VTDFFFSHRAITAARACSEDRALLAPVAFPPFAPAWQEKCAFETSFLQHGHSILVSSNEVVGADFKRQLRDCFMRIAVFLASVTIALLNILSRPHICAFPKLLVSLSRRVGLKSPRLCDCPRLIHQIAISLKSILIGLVAGQQWITPKGAFECFRHGFVWITEFVCSTRLRVIWGFVHFIHSRHLLLRQQVSQDHTEAIREFFYCLFIGCRCHAVTIRKALRMSTPFFVT
jgi:hypothetical protein